jgi:N-(2-amino-2-carboxyethyl)-L-glutamate synthase
MTAESRLLDRVAILTRMLRPTPIVRVADDRVDLFAKLEFLNGLASLKDRPALWILKRAIERGEVGPGTTLVESSSGNFGRALALFAAMLDLDFIPVIDPNASPLLEASLEAQCARVVKVCEPDDAGGYLKSRLRMVRTLLAEIPGAYWPNQYGNVDAIDAHYRLTGGEIVEALPSVDYVFVAVSTAGTIAGVSRRLKEHDPRVKIVAVDSEGSVIFGHPPKPRRIPGLGSSIRPALLQHALIDDVVIVPEAEAIRACHELLERHGLFVGGSSGSCYAAIGRYFAGTTPVVRPRVLFLCCDSGAGYLHNVFDRLGSARAEVPSTGAAPRGSGASPRLPVAVGRR